MKKSLKCKKLYKKIFIVAILFYVVYLFIGQQKTLNSYKSSQAYYAKQLSEKQAYQESLTESKSNINSPEYIEKMAREKLDMYLPNETVFVDKSK